MKWFANIKIGTKLLASFIMVALIAGVIGYLGISALRTSARLNTELFEENTVPMEQIGRLGVNFQRVRSTLRDVLIDKDSSTRNNYISMITELDNNIATDLAAYEKGIVGDKQRKACEDFKSALDQFNAIRDQVISLAMANEYDQALALMRGDAAEVAKAADDAVVKIFYLNVEQGKAKNAQNSDNAASATRFMIIFIIIGVGFAVGLGIVITRNIRNPLAELVGVAEAAAAGDLTKDIVMRSQDEIGQLAHAFHDMMGALRNLVKEAQETSLNLSSSAQEISASTEEMASGANQQGQQTQQISESIQQLAATVEQVAANAQNAGNAAKETNQAALEGEESLNRSSEGMQVINEQIAKLGKESKQIGAIIEVIDDIAEQTNLLALNAAIEAARAGEHGKGFAVVAEEVRKLAERSGQATKEIAELINNIQQEITKVITAVENGAQLTSEAGEAFQRISEMVKKTYTMITEIAAATQQQAAGSNEMVSGIQSIAAISEESAAGTEEIAGATQALSALAEKLQQLIGAFRI